MKEKEFLDRIADLWLELGGDSEGVAWVWRDLMDAIEEKEEERKEASND